MLGSENSPTRVTSVDNNICQPQLLLLAFENEKFSICIIPPGIKIINYSLKTHIHHISPSFSVIIVVGAIIQISVLLLHVLASEAALDLAMAAIGLQHVDEPSQGQSNHKADHSDENVEADCHEL